MQTIRYMLSITLDILNANNKLIIENIILDTTAEP